MEKNIAKLKKQPDAKQPTTREKRKAELLELEQQLQRLTDADSAVHVDDVKDITLPGYMLIIDEPENGLHPNAIRAASEYLYSLADDPSWQVMLATHSPVFINPLYDHTTIIRLDRSQQNPSPNAYRSDSIRFSPDDAKNLKMLNRFDPGFAEMFFGQYPILIEGDTEFAAFESIVARHPERFPLSKKPVFVRARGKHTMSLIIQMLREFKVPFAILHDVDSPTLENGNKNSAWTANESIYRELSKARKAGIRVVHRVSMANFEDSHLPRRQASDKDKPWRFFDAIENDSQVERSVVALLCDLTNPNGQEEPFDKPFDEAVRPEWDKWKKAHG